MTEPQTRLDRFNFFIKNNPIVASLIIFGTIVITLSSFTDATIKILDLIATQTRPDINGQWIAEVNYDWGNSKYSEKLTFSGNGEEVYGVASYAGVKNDIINGKVNKDKLEFSTKSRELIGDSETDETHRYQGTILRDEIKFVIQTEGHIPIEFIARRLSNSSIQPTH